MNLQQLAITVVVRSEPERNRNKAIEKNKENAAKIERDKKAKELDDLKRSFEEYINEAKLQKQIVLSRTPDSQEVRQSWSYKYEPYISTATSIRGDFAISKSENVQPGMMVSIPMIATLLRSSTCGFKFASSQYQPVFDTIEGTFNEQKHRESTEFSNSNFGGKVVDYLAEIVVDHDTEYLFEITTGSDVIEVGDIYLFDFRVGDKAAERLDNGHVVCDYYLTQIASTIVQVGNAIFLSTNWEAGIDPEDGSRQFTVTVPYLLATSLFDIRPQ